MLLEGGLVQEIDQVGDQVVERNEEPSNPMENTSKVSRHEVSIPASILYLGNIEINNIKNKFQLAYRGHNAFSIKMATSNWANCT